MQETNNALILDGTAVMQMIRSRSYFVEFCQQELISWSNCANGGSTVINIKFFIQAANITSSGFQKRTVHEEVYNDTK